MHICFSSPFIVLIIHLHPLDVAPAQQQTQTQRKRHQIEHLKDRNKKTPIRYISMTQANRLIAFDSPGDGRQEKKLFSLSSRGRMALLWASIIALFGWFVLERSLLLQSTSSPPSPMEVEPTRSIIIGTPTPFDAPASATESTPPRQPQPSAAVSTPKMIDIILFNSELDLLELRLNELNHVVDTFVIIESNATFSGHPKKLYYKTFSRHFEKFNHKIHHIELPPMSQEAKRYSDDWGNERYARDKGVSIAIQELQPRDGDWLLLSDLDELPRPSVLLAMKYPEENAEISSMFLERSIAEGGALDLFRLGCRFYYYSFEYYKGNWIGPVVMRFRAWESHLARVEVDGSESAQMLSQKTFMATMGLESWTTLGSKMRDARGQDAASWVDDACWHCSWCFSRISEVVEKTRAYSHTEHNQGQYQQKEWILDHYRRGEDLFNRNYETHTLVQRNYDIPDYVRYNRNKYLYMLERYEAPGAGFIDVEVLPLVTTEAVVTTTTITTTTIATTTTATATVSATAIATTQAEETKQGAKTAFTSVPVAPNRRSRVGRN
ncbi:hypothetical protein MVEG_07630 [Podila verticillata NRRL 6337]|nr:hypothetical protein MVEG_07630 [Podila verticillata NRRL 6337]